MLGGPERINAEPAHSHLTVLVVRSGRSISCIVEGSGSLVFYDRRLRDLRRAHAWDRRLAYAILRWRLRENRYAHPRARPWSALVRWTGSGVRYTHGPRSHYESTTHYGYPGAVQVARQTPARPARNHGGVRGAGPNPQSRKREAKPQCTVAPNPIPTEI